MLFSATPVRIYLSTHSTTFVTEKVIEMEIGIYITATIIYLGRELCLGVCVTFIMCMGGVKERPCSHASAGSSSVEK